jgi:hypothetical protein
VQLLGQLHHAIVSFKTQKVKGKKVKDKKVEKLSLGFFYSKVEIKSKSFTF